MKSELKNEPAFLLTTLCLFYPFGLLFLLRSDLKRKIKWFLGAIGLLIFAGLLSLSLLRPSSSVDLSQIQLRVTRETLSVGQSGGFILTDGTTYCVDYTVHSSGNCLQIHGSAYNATSPGKSILTIQFQNEIRTIEITVTDEPGTDRVVLASPSGERYHRSDARHAGKKATAMTEEEALLSGKTPCKTCF